MESNHFESSEKSADNLNIHNVGMDYMYITLQEWSIL